VNTKWSIAKINNHLKTVDNVLIVPVHDLTEREVCKIKKHFIVQEALGNNYAIMHRGWELGNYIDVNTVSDDVKWNLRELLGWMLAMGHKPDVAKTEYLSTCPTFEDLVEKIGEIVRLQEDGWVVQYFTDRDDGNYVQLFAPLSRDYIVEVLTQRKAEFIAAEQIKAEKKAKPRKSQHQRDYEQYLALKKRFEKK
jgi:hypothetical protein